MKLEDYANKVKGRICVGCRRFFPSPVKIEHYDHSGGWIVEGFSERQWLYVVCPSCEYQNALWKLGIAGDVNPIHEKIALEQDAIYRHSRN